VGRAGIEPATLGLKVDAAVFRILGNAGRSPSLSQINSGGLRVLWRPLVDLLLTSELPWEATTRDRSDYRVRRRVSHLLGGINPLLTMEDWRCDCRGPAVRARLLSARHRDEVLPVQSATRLGKVTPSEEEPRLQDENAAAHPVTTRHTNERFSTRMQPESLPSAKFCFASASDESRCR
jgi:hypothetical protein